jgi:hypothetical protein
MTISAIVQKLRLKPGQSILILNAPETFFVLPGKLPENNIETGIVSGNYNFVHLFVKDSNELRRYAYETPNSLGEDTVFWISYPKQTSKINTALNRDTGRELIYNTVYRPV